MPTARYTRIDGRSSSSNWSMVAIVGFVGVCLVAGWMIVSSSVSPLQNARISFQQFVGGRENGNMPSKESESSSGRGQEESFAKDSSSDNTSMVVSSEEKNEGKSDKEDPEDNNVANTAQEMPSKESESSRVSGQEERFAKDSSSDNTLVVSTEEKNEDKSDNVVPEDNMAADTTQEKSYNLVPTDKEKVTRHEDNKDGAYGTNDGPGIYVPVGSPVAVKQDKIEMNAKDADLPNQGRNFDGRSYSFGNESSTEPAVNKTVNAMGQGTVKNPIPEKVGQNQAKDSQKASDGNVLQSSLKGNPEMQNETSTQPTDWPTQSAESEKEKALQDIPLPQKPSSYSWKLCNTSGGADYIPCLDNIKTIKKLRSTKHYEHRERHCPDEPPSCLVPLPERYRSPVKWPKSRDKIWFLNIPHTQLAEYKGGQNWVNVSGQFIIFPGGGTQFPHGAPHYIDLIQQAIPEIAWGKRTRVILDVGCGVASFGGYLFDKDVLTMSMAPKDEHEAQVQFALERGIPAISDVMGTKRLLFPSKVFDIIHCSRCRVPWHIEGGKLLLELNRVLRPGGYFVWSATPVYRNNDVDVSIWKEMYRLTKAICWELVKISRDKLNRKATALFRKTAFNDCYQSRLQNDPPLCEESDDPDDAWNVTLKACIHKLPEDPSDRGTQWPELWPSRLEKPPFWLKDSEVGVYGKPAPKDFTEDYEYWKQLVSDSYLNQAAIDWPSVRNVMDMRAVYGGFAAALKDLQVWVMNVVPVDSTNTLPLIYERGLFGMYHDWCESFNTYPRTYDLLHADHLLSGLRRRCNNFVGVIAEVDRILRPGGKLIVIDDAQTISMVEAIAKSLKWMVLFKNDRNNDIMLCVKKSLWRPAVYEIVESAFA